MIRTFAAIVVLDWLAIATTYCPRLLIACLMVAAVHLAAAAFAVLMLFAAWLLGL